MLNFMLNIGDFISSKSQELDRPLVLVSLMADEHGQGGL